jgi:hypothetical protein
MIDALRTAVAPVGHDGKERKMTNFNIIIQRTKIFT